MLSMVSVDRCDHLWIQDRFTSLVHEHKKMLLPNYAISNVVPLSNSIGQSSSFIVVKDANLATSTKSEDLSC